MAKSKNEKISDSMQGNKNAEKWTHEKAVELFNLVIDKSKEKTDYMVSGKKIKGFLCHFIGEAADEAGSNLDQIDYLKGKFKLNELYSTIKRKCERNCFTDSKKGIIVSSLAIVNLKSNHGWKDRVDNTSGDKPIEPMKITKEGVKEISKKLDDIL